MPGRPPVSVIINNYNYAQFICAAIESALDQTLPGTEVIVVDDGSEDNSREVIARYGERITAIYQANGGQASALNAGFAQSHGEAIIFLDADDVLLPDTALRVAAAFVADPGAAKVQYRMEIIDGLGRPSGEIKPPPYLPLLSGDLRPHILAFPDDLTRMATSGNGFRASVLRQVLPIPESGDGHGADWYLAAVTPLFGTVHSFDWVGARYRVHDSNFHNYDTLDLSRIRRAIKLMAMTHFHIARFARELRLGDFPQDPNRVLSVAFVGHRLVSYKLDPAHHPIPNESTWSLFREGVAAARRRFDASRSMKLMFVLWFAAMALARGRAARRLAELFLFPESRGDWTKLLRWVHSGPLPAQ